MHYVSSFFTRMAQKPPFSLFGSSQMGLMPAYARDVSRSGDQVEATFMRWKDDLGLS